MKLAEHLFVSDGDGALFDTRVVDWFKRPLRAIFRRHFTRIDNTHQLRATLRAGPYTWPGAYPLYFETDDGSALSFATVHKHYAQCARVIRDAYGYDTGGWRVVACLVNWEDTDLRCAHTGELIPSAYGPEHSVH